MFHCIFYILFSFNVINDLLWKPLKKMLNKIPTSPDPSQPGRDMEKKEQFCVADF